MTREEFFSGIEGNLRRLKDARIAVPDCNLPGLLRGDGYQRILRSLMKIRTLKKLTDKDASTPVNVRVYDLVSNGLPGIPRQKFRVFAAFVDEPTREAYKEIKFRIRKWYQESGWAFACDKPYAGAMVVGSVKAWPEGMVPNADDIPFDEVEFHVLSATRLDPRQGVETVTLGGDSPGGAVVLRALGEDFESQKKRVEDYVQQQFVLPEVARELVSVAVVAAKTRIPEDDVSYIFNDLQGEGKLTVRKAKNRFGRSGKTAAESIFVVDKPPSFWRQLVSKHQGAWFTQTGFCTLLSVGTIGLLLHLVWGPLKGFVSDFISGDTSILLYVIGGLAAAGFLLLALKFFIRNR